MDVSVINSGFKKSKFYFSDCICTDRQDRTLGALLILQYCINMQSIGSARVHNNQHIVQFVICSLKF